MGDCHSYLFKAYYTVNKEGKNMGNLTGRLEKETLFYEKMDAKLKDLPPIINEYYISLRANRKSYTSIGVYISNILHFAKFLNTETIPNDFYKKVATSDVEKYFISLETKSNGSRMGDDALQQRWSSLNNFFGFLVKRNYLSDNPIINVERPKNNTEHKVTFLNKVEINRLLKAVANNPSKVLAARDGAIIKLALSTGLRVSALININIEDIDFENSVINVIEKRKKVRGINIGDNIKQVLKQWIEIRNKEFKDMDTTALFISLNRQRISVDAVTDMLTRYCDKAGIKRITPHKLRATAACMLAKNGLPVKAIAKQLGHSGIGVTMRYIDVFKEDEEKTTSVLDGLI